MSNYLQIILGGVNAYFKSLFCLFFLPKVIKTKDYFTFYKHDLIKLYFGVSSTLNSPEHSLATAPSPGKLSNSLPVPDAFTELTYFSAWQDSGTVPITV